MLKQLPLSLLTSNELATTADRIVSAIDEPLKAAFQKRTDKIKKASGQLITALNKDRSSDYTPRLSEADQQRDDAYLALKHALLSAAYRPAETLKTAGDTLLDILKRHNSTLYDLGYVAQSAEMKSLRAELAQNQPALEKTSVQALLDEMNQAMDNFDALYQQKLDAESGISLPLITENRDELARQLGLLLSHVEIMQEDEEDGVATLVDKFNDIITDTMSTVRARQTRQENVRKEEEEL